MENEYDEKTELEILEEKKQKRINKMNDIYYKQLICKHEWGKTFYDPYQEEATRERFVYQGSDSYYTYEGTGMYYEKDRWTRICKKCGKKEHAYDYEEVEVVQKERKLKFK